VTLTVDSCDRDEESVTGVEAERLSGDRIAIAFVNNNALAIEVLTDRAGRHNKVIDVSVLWSAEVQCYTLRRVAAGREVCGESGARARLAATAAMTCAMEAA